MKWDSHNERFPRKACKSGAGGFFRGQDIPSIKDSRAESLILTGYYLFLEESHNPFKIKSLCDMFENEVMSWQQF